MTTSLDQLIAEAEHLANSGQWQQAETAWQTVHARAPSNAKALFGLGFHALHAGDAARAHGYLSQCVSVAPKDLMAHLTLASTCRELGREDEEFQTINQCLVIEPYCLPALLTRGAWHERRKQPLPAVSDYRNALKIAPAIANWPAALADQLQHAARVVSAHQQKYWQYLTRELAPQVEQLPPEKHQQWEEGLSIFSGRSKPYLSQSNQLHVPRLPAIPFYDRGQFPWLSALEQKWEAIRDEFAALLADQNAPFAPYIQYAPGQPVNQWQELNQNSKWSALHLYRGGEPVAETLARCPVTASVLAELELVSIDGLCPNAMFSVLAPKTHIPPHTGETNARLVAHLPLIVPDGCRIRVGYEERNWTPGEVLIFDDTLEHEAVNSSEELRAVLIFDVWNPLLSADERRLVQSMASAARKFTP